MLFIYYTVRQLAAAQCIVIGPVCGFVFVFDYIPSRTLQSSNKLLLTIPRMSLTMSAKSFSLSSPSVWKSLRYSCRSTKTMTAFKRALKMELFATAYGSH